MIKAFTVLLAVGGLLAGFKGFGEGQDGKAEAIHRRAITVDTHCDTPMALVRGNLDVGKKNEAPGSRVDFPRMKEGGLDAIFFAAFTGQRPRTAENTQEAYTLANKMIEKTYEVCAQYSELAEVATAPEDVFRLEKEGKRAIYIGMENGFPIGTELERVEEFYNKGVRYITLCHSSNNDICDSSTDRKGPEHDGLSTFGKQVVKEMNRLGMLVDVSHISDKAFFDVVELSEVPVFASHSSVRAIAHHNRNMTDEMIKALAKNGGVIQICLLDDYVKDPDTTTVRYQKEQELREIFSSQWSSMSEDEKEVVRKKWRGLDDLYPKQLPAVADYVDHIDYVKKLVGVDYVGIGSDFDGGGGLADCADVSEMPNITAEMVKRGYTEEEIAKVWGGNFFRVFTEAVKATANN
ncbi:dipeptidase [uncultured Draconibacterium sp.]|uniref:dipeptidase n=1 Tax=uncultured Draconibacterium sp. TaxID=1573823 RepID=UPI0025D40137|nr:dipeptidase [uncultured Draconibacterium sp.]